MTLPFLTTIDAVCGFRPFTRAQRAEVEAEGAALVALLRPGDPADVRVT